MREAEMEDDLREHGRYAREEVNTHRGGGVGWSTTMVGRVR